MSWQLRFVVTDLEEAKGVTRDDVTWRKLKESCGNNCEIIGAADIIDVDFFRFI